MRPSIRPSSASVCVVLAMVAHAGPASADGDSWRRYSRPTAPELARPDAERALCDGAVCVHVARDTPRASVAPTLAAAVRARAALVALGLPPPPSDGGLGGGLELDVYLDARALGGAAYPDPLPRMHFDVASGFALVSAEGDGCVLDVTVTRAVAQLFLFGLDAALGDGTLAMQSSYLASFIAPCHAVELDAIDRFQRAPERAITRGDRRVASGAMLFPWYFDLALGHGDVGAVMNGLIATSCQLTPDGSHWFDDEPDIFDALRKIMPTRNATLSGVLLDFAIARAFVGDRSDGAHLPETERFGALGRVRFDWSIALTSLPRRLAPAYDVEPTGASYLWLDTRATPHGAFHLFAEWEATQAFDWALVRIDAQGRELGRLTSIAVFGHDSAELTLDDVDGAAAVMVVGVNVGSDDRSKPFDPDDGEPQAAGFTVTLRAK